MAGPDKYIINLEQIVKDWADRQYDKIATFSQRCLRKKEKNKGKKYIEHQIDWSATRFSDETFWGDNDPDGIPSSKPPKEVLEMEETDPDERPSSKPPKEVLETEESDPDERPSSKPPKEVLETEETTTSVLFKTKYVNNTDHDQEYTMQTQKVTKSSLTTSVEKGVTKGSEFGLKLMTPKQIIEANVGFKREVTLKNTEGETVEEEMRWGVNSVIKVKGKQVAEASLVVTELKQHARYWIRRTISGMVYVTFTNSRDNNSFLMSTGHDIVDIVRQYIEKEKKKEPLVSSIVRVEEREVKVKTTGKCNFRYGVSQKVKVSERPITAEDLKDNDAITDK